MKMVKIFSSNREDVLEEKINAFFKEVIRNRYYTKLYFATSGEAGRVSVMIEYSDKKLDQSW